ncbi:hypothetical protein [Brumimicrobium aurantiacum]|uniref:Lipoprotein n=1 Tax=Brumimicrobium aurantiacum TaxID=1737063 RepID=A0A3E1EWJ6_9FLAO|nr:hypothetical protein [Brumimicrobium aurantiacum]RFC53931.1 hypothetical protein DXU93_10305 [Brumimicrobium aurantiacum]
MNKLFNLILGSSILLFSSCGGGWSEDQKTTVKNECITMGTYDCDCYLDKATSTFKNPDEYNQEDSELHKKFETAITECEVEVESNEETMESF